MRRREDFAAVYERGRKFVAPSFVLYLLPAPEVATAVVASKRVGGAVRRNRAKRLLRHLLRETLLERHDLSPRFLASPLHRALFPDGEAKGLWIVLVARQAILQRGIHDLVAEMERVLAREEEDRRADRARHTPGGR